LSVIVIGKDIVKGVEWYILNNVHI